MDRTDSNKVFKRLSRKTEVNILRSEIYFENKINKFDLESNRYINNHLNDFNKKEKMILDHLLINGSDDIIEKYRRKLTSL